MASEKGKPVLTPVMFAVASATMFGIGTPFSKILVAEMSPVALAGILYIGAFVGLSAYALVRRALGKGPKGHARIERKDAVWLSGAVVFGGVIAPICLMVGLTMVSGFSASLLLNLEGVATALIAASFFGENLSRKLLLAIACMTAAGAILSYDPSKGEFGLLGPALLVGASVSWGLDNNFTRNICTKDPVVITQFKGGAAGLASLVIAVVLAETIALDWRILAALLVGAVSIGGSIAFYVFALQGLGASRTAAFFSLGPFVGAAASIPLLGESLIWTMPAAAGLMVLGAWSLTREGHAHEHGHERLTHTHIHSHSSDGHDHDHAEPVRGPHSHAHTHPEKVHTHQHWPDVHHRHRHTDRD